jgi:hypothetical protein
VSPPAQVKTAIQSNYNGSAAGPEDMMLQLLKDLLLWAADNSPFPVAITDLINVLFNGKTPPFTRRAIFGVNLLAIGNKNRDITPIAVNSGYVSDDWHPKWPVTMPRMPELPCWRRDNWNLGVSGGAEAAVYEYQDATWRTWNPARCLLKSTFEKVLNTLRRDSILKEVAEHFPELLPYASTTISCPSDL